MPRAGFSDPVLEQIIADLRELKSEVEADRAPRKQTMRAIESTLGIQAAHFNAHYDTHVRTALRRREARLGRAGFVQELLNVAHDRKQHDVTYQAIDAALTRLDERGVSGVLRDVRQAIRNIRLNAPDGLQPATLRGMQFDYCSDLRWMIRSWKRWLRSPAALRSWNQLRAAKSRAAPCRSRWGCSTRSERGGADAMTIRYPGHFLKTRTQAALQLAVIVGILGPLLAWRINTERPGIAMALGGLTLVPVVTAYKAWRFLAKQERRHQQPTPEMIFIFELIATMPLVMGAFLMILMFELGR